MDPIKEKTANSTPPPVKKQLNYHETRLERAGNQSFSNLRKSIINNPVLTLSGSLRKTPRTDKKLEEISACLAEEKKQNRPRRSRNRSMPEPPSPGKDPPTNPIACTPSRDRDSFSFFSIRTQKKFRTKSSSLPPRGYTSLPHDSSNFDPLFQSQSSAAQRLSDLSRLLTLGSDNQITGGAAGVILQDILQTATAILLDNKTKGLSTNDANLIVLFLKNLETNEWAKNILLTNNKLWPLRLSLEKELNEGLPMDFIKKNLYDGEQSLQDLTFQIAFFSINTDMYKLFVSQLSQDLNTLFSTLFSNILLREFNEGDSHEKTVNIHKMNAFTKRLSKYLQAQLKNPTLQPKGRANLHDFYIDILHRSLTLGNYHGALAIYSVIKSRDITNLKIESSPKKKQILLLAETTLSDRENYENLQKAHKQPPSKDSKFITPALEILLQQFSVINSLGRAHQDTKNSEQKKIEEQIIKIQARIKHGTLQTNLLYTLLYSNLKNLPSDFDPSQISIKTAFRPKKEKPRLRKKNKN